MSECGWIYAVFPGMQPDGGRPLFPVKRGKYGEAGMGRAQREFARTPPAACPLWPFGSLPRFAGADLVQAAAGLT
jgi:hypothetical protein